MYVRVCETSTIHCSTRKATNSQPVHFLTGAGYIENYATKRSGSFGELIGSENFCSVWRCFLRINAAKRIRNPGNTKRSKTLYRATLSNQPTRPSNQQCQWQSYPKVLLPWHHSFQVAFPHPQTLTPQPPHPPPHPRAIPCVP